MKIWRDKKLTLTSFYFPSHKFNLVIHETYLHKTIKILSFTHARIQEHLVHLHNILVFSRERHTQVDHDTKDYIFFCLYDSFMEYQSQSKHQLNLIKFFFSFRSVFLFFSLLEEQGFFLKISVTKRV